METLYSLPLPSKAIWEPEYEGVFLHINSRVCFAYKQGKTIHFSTIEDERIVTKEIMTDGVDLPVKWILVNNGSCLMCSERYCFDLNAMQPCVNINEQYRQEYFAKSLSRGMHLVNDDYVFGDYTISHYKECGFLCKKSGKQIWKVNCRGYLYTDIRLYHDCILFGTDGMGGHFYVIELSTGEIKCDINTHGTKDFIVYNNMVYLLSRKENKILEVSADTWIINDEVALAGKVSSSSRFIIDGDRIFAVTFEYMSRRPRRVLINAVRK